MNQNEASLLGNRSPIEEDPAYEIYSKMMSVGLPIGAARDAMRRNRLDLSNAILETQQHDSESAQTQPPSAIAEQEQFAMVCPGKSENDDAMYEGRSAVADEDDVITNNDGSYASMAVEDLKKGKMASAAAKKRPYLKLAALAKAKKEAAAAAASVPSYSNEIDSIANQKIRGRAAAKDAAVVALLARQNNQIASAAAKSNNGCGHASSSFELFMAKRRASLKWAKEVAAPLSHQVASIAKQKMRGRAAAKDAVVAALLARQKNQIASAAAMAGNHGLNHNNMSVNGCNSSGKLTGIRVTCAAVSSTYVYARIYARFKQQKEEERLALLEPPFLWKLIKAFEWNSVQDYIVDSNDHKEECKWTNSKGLTALHLVCSIGSAPMSTVRAIFGGWEDAALKKNIYGDLPLHAECRQCQMSFDKVKFLIDHGGGISMLNVRNQSPLHVACESNAMLSVVVELVKADPSMLLVKDQYGLTPAALTWQTWSKNLFGMLNIGKVNASTDLSNEKTILGRFWKKMAFLVLKIYYLTKHDFCHDRNNCSVSDYVNSPLLLHAILHMEMWPVAYITAVMAKYPYMLRTADESGNLPLHIAAGRRVKYGNKTNVLQKILREFPGAAQIPNNEGRFPLNIAIESCVLWNNGVEQLFLAAPGAVTARDTRTHLYPFMLAASLVTSSPTIPQKDLKNENDNSETFNSAFSLLRAQPDVVKCGITRHLCCSDNEKIPVVPV